ncbi:filamentous hemagglutinin family protein [Luteolibacter flavescens]|uniref:Filamentous hemagglutinin family protein n=1 Tax=Luteolibacter flavescens TaxID=1859460 RepID=A0ABT3FUN3_9BACT|nr:filamentous haemagglutinin family protein [Luteolibacter flavescens]MCW1887292.1 filamentous hemagglutinin family protein [Luteolibacter flavescens]
MNIEATMRHSLLTTALHMTWGMSVLMMQANADILRGGGGSGGAAPPAASATPSGGTTPSVTNQARTNAQDSLARTTQAIAAVRAMQLAARNNAVNGPNNLGNHPGTGAPLPNVPNGLGQGGLQVHGNVATDASWWQGAELPTQTTDSSGTKVTIKQTAQQALLNWETFNVGKDTTLTFDQSAAGSGANQWIAFNKVNDPLGNPTQILGTIKAQGQVYVINRNGVIFGGSSQVNTGALTVSALPINDELVANGLLNNPTQAFLFNGLGQGDIGDVTVQAGAQIKTSVSADGNGGRIFLAGANVTNDGTLSSPSGQVILAAGLQVGVVAHNTADPSLRGLDVFVGAVVDPASALSPYAGTVTNNGLIEIARGSTLLTGKTIAQNGAIDSTTSVSLNGRVDLLANYDAVSNPGFVASNPNTGSAFAWRSTGNITLGENSVIRILPELTSTATSIGTELALRSQINLQGKNIHHAQGSILLAPNAKASIQAGTWAFLNSTTLPTSNFVSTGGQVFLDHGSVINLAGTTDALASVLQNIIELELRGSELSVAPVQREGELRGETIVVDLGKTGTYDGRQWVGTPLADLIGYLGLVQRDVAQLTTAGGTLTISAGDAAVVRDGSVIDVSGGWTNFKGGTVATTRVVSNGQIVDISQATPDQVYSGIYTGNSSVAHSKWGVVEKFSRALAPAGTRYQEGYTQGANAGSVTITAPAIVLDGSLRGNTVAGENQIRNQPGSSALPKAATLALHFRGRENLAPNYFVTYPDGLDIVFKEGVEQDDVPDFALDANGNAVALPDARKNEVFLSPGLLTSSGFGHLAVTNENGTITVAEGQHLTASPGGSISLTASNIDILGNVTAAGGSLFFTALNASPYDVAVGLSQNPPVAPPIRPGRGIFTLAEGATLSTAGLVTDDRFASSYATPAIADGGSIRIEAYSADLGSGSLVDVSGGYAMNSDGRGRYGNAGSISILTGKDPGVSSNLGGTLHLGGALRGISGGKGGTLTLQAGAIQVGGATAPAGVYHLDPSFFSEGGFTKFNIQGLGGPGLTAVKVAENTLLTPVAKRLAAVANSSGGGLRLGEYADVHGRDPEVSERQAVSLSFTSDGVRDAATGFLLHRGDVVIGEGSVIRTDPGAAVEVRGSTATVLGSILAPAGSIRVSGSSNSGNVFGDPNQAVATTFLGSHSVLSTAGTVVLRPDAYGRRIGSVLGGGSISVSGNLVASAGAVLDVSGTSGVLDVDPAYTTTPSNPVPTTGLTNRPRIRQTVPVQVDSNAGSITLTGGQFLFSDATLRGNAGGASASGGSLSISSGRFYTSADVPSPADVTLTITQSGPVIGSSLSNNSIGQTITGTLGSGHGFFAVDSFQSGGFDSLALGGVVRTSGAVTIDARGQVSLGNQGILFNDSALTVRAGAVSIGMPFRPPQLPTEEVSPIIVNGSPFIIPATYGSGTLDIEARHIDVGSLSLQGTGRANLVAEGGDVRGNGTFVMAGDLSIRAGQIYPTTASEFNLIAYDYQNVSGAQKGSITITSSGSRSLPYSAGGKLGIYASTIHQGGVLRAPFGTITLGWDGSGTAPRDWFTGTARPFPVTSDLTLESGSITSVSSVDPVTGKGLVLPYGYSPDGTVWIDPRGVDITAGGLPEKSITLSGGNITQEAGSSIDLRGGGDLYADRWVSGLGGPVDILANTGSFAIIPSYGADYAPYAAYNDSAATTNLIGGASGYTNSTLAVGDRVYLQGSKTLAAGWYTLLPARYALLPDAVLVSASDAGGYGTLEVPGGASIVNGYRYNSLNDERAMPAITTRFEVASSKVVRQRAQYFDFLANTFLKQSAATLNAPAPVLPTDSGYLRFQATQSMDLAGAVASQSISGGRGASIDISTQLDTFISNGTTSGGPGVITLDSAALNAFGAESLLIGGTRSRNADGTSTVTVSSGKITVDNAGAPLGAEDLILAAKNQLVLAAGAKLVSTGDRTSGADTLRITGDGALVRVSGNPTATVLRSGTTSSATPLLSIGAGAGITGGGIILDSTAGLSLDGTASLSAESYTFGAGRISVMLDPSLAVPAGGSLVLDNDFLATFGTAASLGLVSYSSIDLHGAGQFGSPALKSLTLGASEIRGVGQGAGTARIVANDVLLHNPNAATAGTPGTASGSLEISAATIRLGSNQVALNHYSNVRLTATRGILGEGTGGLSAQAGLTLDTPRLTGAAGAVRTITAGGNLALVSTTGSNPAGGLLAGGAGSTLTLTGSSIAAGSEVLLESGNLSLRATTGDLAVTGRLDVSGGRKVFGDAVRYSSAGNIRLTAYAGNVTVASAATLDLSAHAGGGNAGTLAISNPNGNFTLAGTLLGSGGSGGMDGSFSLDTSVLPSLSGLAASLRNASFTGSQDFRVRSGDVTLDGLSVARDFVLSADRGGITVTGTVDVSGATGGSIRLAANGDLVLAAGSRLDASGDDFSNAGKGGAITLEAGSSRDGAAGPGALTLRSGSSIDLSVAANNAGSAAQGKFTGKLHLRAPQIAGDMAVTSLDSTVTGASSILVEGYKIYDLTSTNGTITTAVQNEIKADGESFLGAAGTASAAYISISNRLLANNAGLASVLVLAPGAEIVHRTGNLTLGTSTSTNTSDWNLANYRFGAKGAAGVLTLRAAGNITLFNAISDGFVSSAYNSLLLPDNATLPVNTRSYSYRFVSGADLGAADHGRTLALDALAAGTGSLLLGKNNTNNFSNSNGSTNNPGNNATTALAVGNRFQVIRTGTGDIDIRAGRSVQLQNHFATIYTAGTVVADPTMGGTFDLPILDQTGGNITLGAIQQSPSYPAQYTMAGGDVSIFAGLDIEHISRTNQNVPIADSQRQLPNNWLYRRGYVDPVTGQFGTSRFGDTASTTWWVDFSNFFQGVGALGGGDVSLVAGHNVNNVDAVIPTNARMPKGTPNAANLVELGGGDLIVRAGNNIDAGVYYVERGRGTLDAGGSIVTNATRSPSIPQLSGAANTFDPHTWLPTTLFLGKGGFEVTALGDLLLGPVANPFLLPPGVNNTYWLKSYFSTYSPESSVSVSSVGGSVTLRNGTTLPVSGAGSSTNILYAWIDRQQVLRTTPASASYYQPWLRIAETSAAPFSTLVSLLPPTLDVTSFSSDINLAGNVTLFPSATGNLELLAGGAINGLQRNGRVTFNGTSTSWGSSRINVSDADPDAIPGITSPYGYTALVGFDQSLARSTRSGFLDFVNKLFRETGATQGSQAILQVKQALHDAGLLHRDDEEPVRLYAGSGDISGLTLFSPKETLVYAARDIVDVSLYLQNVRASDTSVVAAGRDIIPSNANSLLRLLANAAGNVVNNDSSANAGDIQISGPGTLQVLAGRTLDLGTGAELADGTAAGITSIGNARNPALSATGAGLIVGAGVSDATSLVDSSLDFAAFIAQYVDTAEGAAYLKELAPGVNFASLDAENQARLALGVFYLILRDAGRNYAEDGNYDTALAAIKVLIGENRAPGDILTRGRSIRTTRGGAINLITPGGGLTLANTAIGNPQSPPGIITESGGDIFTYANNDVNIGIGRIFTLRGGNQVIWSTKGDIAAGSSSKTVTSAPPTRVLIDPQSAAVQTDLAGLATGGGIGALATVAGVPLGDVDLIAPEGTVDAGDAGIRVSGNLNIAANQVLNAGNIAVGGSSAGTPAAPSAPSVSTVTNASTAVAAAGETATAPQQTAPTPENEPVVEEIETVVTVEVLGYSDDDDEEEEDGEEDSQ